MPPESDVKFEIHVRDRDRWSIMTDSPTKLRAIDEGKNLLGSGRYDAVKVTEERGQKREIIVWQQETAKSGAKATTIVPIDESPVCTSIDDMYRFAARKAAGRLLRKHLDGTGITAFELVHDANRLKELRANENYFVQAIQFAGNLQSKGTEYKPHERIDFLEEATDELIAHHAKIGAQEGAVDILKKSGVAALSAHIKGSVPEESRQYVVRRTLGEHLSRKLDWEGKLVLLLDIADKNADADSLELIDEVIAEILDGSDAVQEILGFQRNLGAALRAIAQVSAGTFEINKDSGSSVERLTQLMQRVELVKTRGVIADRLVRELSGINKLTRSDDPADERDAFGDLMEAVFKGRIPARASEICEAATLRAKSLFKDQYGEESSEKAIDDMIALLHTEAEKFNYLLDLANSDFGQKNLEHIISRLAHVVDGMQHVSDLVEYGSNKIDLIRTAAAIRDRLLETKLPDEWRARFAKKIYDLLMEAETGQKPAPSKAASDQSADGADGQSDAPLNRQTIEEGAYLFHEGDEGDLAYLVVSGEIEILRGTEDDEVVVAHAGAGSIIGEMALIDSAPRMASARAAEETQVTVIPQKDLQARLDRLGKVDPVMRRLVGMFVQRLRDFPIIDVNK